MHYRRLHCVSRELMENYLAFQNSQLHWLWLWSVTQILSISICPSLGYGLLFALCPTPAKALPGLIGWQTIPIFMCVHLLSSGLDLDISEMVQSKTVFIFPLHEKNHTNEFFRYYISQRIKTGKLSGWLCLALELDTRSLHSHHHHHHLGIEFKYSLDWFHWFIWY